MNDYYVTFFNTITNAWWSDEIYADSFASAQRMAEGYCPSHIVISDICDDENVRAAAQFNAAKQAGK